MRIMHIDFDELEEIPSKFHKALQILGILLCDFLDASHPLFEEASEKFLINTRSEKTHTAVKNICDDKIRDITE